MTFVVELVGGLQVKEARWQRIQQAYEDELMEQAKQRCQRYSGASNGMASRGTKTNGVPQNPKTQTMQESKHYVPEEFHDLSQPGPVLGVAFNYSTQVLDERPLG